ncbi:hypothetical protein [Halobiforma nitratireducens]|uniref:hypothetical protein n=1 Tax=Halobiforma nitratireducens TaxID=130048 RepID=UPI00135F114A
MSVTVTVAGGGRTRAGRVDLVRTGQPEGNADDGASGWGGTEAEPDEDTHTT